MSKHKAGRKSDTATVGVRVSLSELAMMRKAAEREGRNLSNWIRTTVIRSLIKPPLGEGGTDGQ